jgi:Bacterial PH domain
MGDKNPAWLQDAREFCRTSGIKIVGWGPDMLTVEAKSQERAREIASQLGELGFKALKQNEDDAYAGLLDLSKNPAAIEARIASFDISRRRWDEQMEPLIWALGTLLLVPGLFTNAGGYPHGVNLPLGVLSLVLFFWDGRRIWGWRLEMLPDGLRVRRGFRWSTIPWEQIRTVESVGRGNQERVVVKLTSHSEFLGTFNFAFARNLRDRLRIEVAQRQGKAT